MRFKVRLGLKQDRFRCIEAPWPTSRGERYFVLTQEAFAPKTVPGVSVAGGHSSAFVQVKYSESTPSVSQPRRTLIRVQRHLGVVVLQEEVTQAFQSATDGRLTQASGASASLHLERMVHLRNLTVHWNPEEGMQQVMAEVVAPKSGILYAGLGYDLPSQVQNNGGGEKAKKLSVRSQMTGKVLKVLVAPGAVVETDTPLVVIEAMKMENRVFASRGGKVLSVAVKAGDLVQNGKELLTIE